MKKRTPLLLLAFATFGGTAFAVRQTTWMPMNYAPAMGHAASPSIQEITKNTPYYTITASVTDLDTFYDNLNPSQTSLQAGDEGDVSLATNINPDSLLSNPNSGFDASSGKREWTYVIKGQPWLATQGEIKYIMYAFKGVDHITAS